MNSKNPLYASFLHSALDLAQSGEKATNLSQMIQDGLPIPPGLVVHHRSFEYFLSSNHLQEQIEELVAVVNHQDPEDLVETAQKIKDLILAGKIPQPIIERIEQLKSSLPIGPYMVRSSAIGEDGEDSSFAGQLDSFQTEGDLDEIKENLKKCWASYYGDRVLFYQKEKGVELKGMGVVIQYMIRPLYAGVLFSRSPMGLDPDEMLIEFCYGHAEKLVSGQINPGAIRMHKKIQDVTILHEPEQSIAGIKLLSGRETWLQNLRQLAITLEKKMGPCDIEWTVDQNQELYLVQSRPITTESHGRWISWSNVNVNENYPRPITPVLYSIALQSFYHYFRDLGIGMGLTERRLLQYEWELKNIIGCHGSRMYYNMTSIHTCIGALPFGQKVSSYFNTFVGDPNDQTKSTKKNDDRKLALQIYELARMIIVTAKTLFCIPSRVATLEKEVDRYLQSTRQHVDTQHLFEHLKNKFHGFLFIRFLRWKNASLADTLAMMSYGILGTFLNRYFKNAAELKNTLLQGIPNVVSSIPPEKIWELSHTIRKSNELTDLFKQDSSYIYERIINDITYSKFKTEFEYFLVHWGHRCSGELMLTEPNFQEDPISFIEILKGYIDCDIESPKVLIAKKTQERKKLLFKVSFQLFKSPLDFILWPFKLIFFHIVVALTAQGIRYRERVRLKQTMIYGAFRKTLLELNQYYKESGLFKDQDDIFFLTFREISELMTGSSQFQHGLHEIVTVRKNEFNRVSLYNPPDNFHLPEGMVYFPGCPIKVITNNDNDALTGLPACGGTIRGRARILNSALEAKKLSRGDILVTKQTDPGWAPVFPLISGLVIERGGMLSHGAIVAREFGIPAIVGVKSATVIIKDGQEITIYGDTGRIEVHE